MTSKRSSRADAHISFMGYTKRRIAIAALIALYTVLGYIVLPIIALTNRSRQYYMWYYPTTDMGIRLDQFMQDGARNLLGFCSPLCFAVMLLAVVTGLQSFFWLYKTQSVDFYESQPIKRSKRFMDITLNSMLLYALISAIGTVISIVIAAAFGATNGAVVTEILLEYVRLLILFFAIQSISVLAEVLSKNIIIAMVLDTIILMGEFAIRALSHEMMEAYYTTFFDSIHSDLSANYKHYITSPIANHIMGYQISSEIEMDAMPSMNVLIDEIGYLRKYELTSLLIGVVAIALAYVVYKNRRAEAIGNGVIYGWLSALIKFIVIIPIGAFTGLAVDYVFDSVHYRITLMLVFMIILVVVILSSIAEIIHAGSIKAILKRAWHMPIIFALSLLAVIFYKYDLSGYDRYVPAADKVADVALYGEWVYKEYYVPTASDDGYEESYLQQYFEDYMHLDKIDEVRQIAALGQAAIRQDELARAAASMEHINGGYDTVYGTTQGNYMFVVYHMKNGSIVNRRILIPYDTDMGLMDSVTADSEYKELLYQTKVLSDYVSLYSQMPDVSYDCGYGTIDSVVEKKAFSDLMSAYSKDLENFSYSYAMTHQPIGVISYTDPTTYIYAYTQFEVYEDYSNTINWLHKNGIWMEPGIPTDRISSIELTDYVYDENDVYTGSRKIDVSDPGEMVQIAEKAIYNSVSTMWSDSYDNDNISIYFTIMPGYGVVQSGYEDNYYGAGYGGFYIPREDAPKDILERLDSAEMGY